jgi:hypothetical protein
MSSITLHEIITYANQINNINNNPYFVQLKGVSPMSPNTTITQTFVTSQVEFAHAIQQWPPLLAKCLQILDTPSERMVIVENLWDEHGEGDVELSHINTYNTYLKSLDAIEYIEFSCDQYMNATHEFTNTLDKMPLQTISQQIEYIAALGMIEYTYITVSNNIHNFVSQYIPTNQIIHYSMHEILDVSHSHKLFRLLTKYDADILPAVFAGIRRGYAAFYELYAQYAICCHPICLNTTTSL